MCAISNENSFVRRITASQVRYLDLTTERLTERDERLGLRHLGQLQDMVEYRVHQVLVVRAVELDQNVVLAGNEVAFGNLGHLTQLLDRQHVLGRVRNPDADNGADIVAERFRIDLESRTPDHAGILELLDALVDRRARNTALARDFQKRHPRVLDQIPQYFAIDRIQ